MSLRSSRVAGFLSSLLLTTTMVSAGFAQATWNYDRISTCTDDAENNSILLTTMKGAPIKAPTIQFLPGPNGHAMMVADFAGLSYMMPPHIIHPVQVPGKAGIEEIRVGQFQVNPPICRIAAISRNPASLKGLSFTSNPAGLIVKWTGAKGIIPEQEEVAEAPQKQNIAGKAPDSTMETTGPKVKILPPVSRDSTTARAAVDLVPWKKAVQPVGLSNLPNPDDAGDSSSQHIQDLLDAARRSKVVPGKLQSLPKQSTGRANPGVESDRNNKLLTSTLQDQTGATDTIKKPLVSLGSTRKRRSEGEGGAMPENGDLLDKEKSDDLRSDKKDENPPGVPMARLSVVTDTEAKEPYAAVQVLSEREITYKSFRLHSPERYVIDLVKPEDLDEATVSMFQENSMCRSVRIGLTDKKTCRLVFDLANEDVQVQEKTFTEDGKVLTLRMFNQPATATNKSNLPLEGVSLVLDAGHGGSDPGAQRGDAHEKDMTLGIVNQLKKKLEAQGAFITMTRNDDTFVSLEDRVKVTNLVMPKAFVSVHINALESTNDIHGIETYYQTEQSRPLAEVIHNSLYTTLNVPNRGVRKARFYVINHTAVPAILAEVGYISNKDEREKLISSDYQSKVADAIAQGVMLYVSKTPETPATTVKTAPVVNYNQRVDRGTTAGQTKSVSASLSGSESDAIRAVK